MAVRTLERDPSTNRRIQNGPHSVFNSVNSVSINKRAISRYTVSEKPGWEGYDGRRGQACGLRDTNGRVAGEIHRRMKATTCCTGSACARGRASRCPRPAAHTAARCWSRTSSSSPRIGYKFKITASQKKIAPWDRGALTAPSCARTRCEACACCSAWNRCTTSRRPSRPS